MNSLIIGFILALFLDASINSKTTDTTLTTELIICIIMVLNIVIMNIIK